MIKAELSKQAVRAREIQSEHIEMLDFILDHLNRGLPLVPPPGFVYDKLFGLVKEAFEEWEKHENPLIEVSIDKGVDGGDRAVVVIDKLILDVTGKSGAEIHQAIEKAMEPKQVTIICANDSMEVAFLPGTDPAIIEEQMKKVQVRVDEPYKNEKIPPSIYVHTHEVNVFGE